MSSSTESSKAILEREFGAVGTYWDAAVEEADGFVTLVKRDSFGNELKVQIEGNELTITFGYWHTHYSLRVSDGNSDLPEVKNEIDAITAGRVVLVARRKNDDWVGASGSMVEKDLVDVVAKRVAVPLEQFGAYAGRSFDSYVVWRWGHYCGLTIGASGGKAAN